MTKKTFEPEKKPTKRTLQAAETKKKLLKAAFSLFAEYGYDNVTVENITTRAGVSKGTFYSHFDTKEGVLAEHFRQVEELYVQTYEKMPKKCSAGEKVVRLVDTVCKFCEKECGVEFMRVIYSNHLLHHEHELNIMSRPDRKSIPILHEIAEEGKRKGEIPKSIDNDVFAREVSHLAHGIIYDWIMENGGFDLRKESRKIILQLATFAAAYHES